MKERISIIFILILGLLGVICGLDIYAETQWFKMNGIKTQREIIELKEENDTKSYRATFVFRDINNNKIKTVSNISTSPPIGKVGEIVNVIYLKDNPTRARIESILWELISLIFSTLIGGLFIKIAISQIKQWKTLSFDDAETEKSIE